MSDHTTGLTRYPAKAKLLCEPGLVLNHPGYHPGEQGSLQEEAETEGSEGERNWAASVTASLLSGETATPDVLMSKSNTASTTRYLPLLH